MNLSAVLNDVLAALDGSDGPILFSHDTVQDWNHGVLDVLMAQGLLKQASVTSSLECRGCEERCFSDVIVQTSPAGRSRAYIVCEVPDKQAEMGRVAVPVERLMQWQSSVVMVARMVAGALGLEHDLSLVNAVAGMRLGMLQSPHGRRWVSLRANSLALEVNQQVIPLSELLYVEKGLVTLDRPRIENALSLNLGSVGKTYSPNTDKREARKRSTEAMRQDWRDAHAQLQREHPGKRKRWYSIRIARLPMACGRDAETIRRQL